MAVRSKEDHKVLSFDDFRKQCNETDRPTLKDLYKHATPHYAAYWEDIGIYLDIEPGCLKIIQKDNPGDASGCCKDLWKKWLEVDLNATWEKLFTAIDDVVISTSGSQGNVSNTVVLVEHLQSSYIATRYIPEGKEWPPNQPKYYVNLAVIHYQGSRTQEEVSFSARHHEYVDNEEKEVAFCNQNFRITRELADLFLPDPHYIVSQTGDNNNLPKSILIEGAPGIGKTILLKEIAYRWANGTILGNARIVFLLYLRDSRFHSVTTINEVIQYIDCLDECEIPTVVKELKQSNGEGVVFLIDGLDEYPGALQNHFLAHLINRKVLPKSVFVITSRPCASVSLHNKVDRRIEILGFGSEEQNEYISESLKSSPKKQKELEKYLEQHPMLSSLAYIPLHLSILLFLFQQGNLPETLTEMNESFILHTVYRHMEKHDIPISCVVKIVNFPEAVYKMIYQLSKLAYQGLLNNQLVFTFDEIKQVSPEVDVTPGALNGFGLLQAVQHYPIKGAGTTYSFNFLHLTVQEFLAAWYISCCPIERQKQLLKESFMKEGFQFVTVQEFLATSSISTYREHQHSSLISKQTKVQWDELKDSNARMWQMYVGIVGVSSEAWVQFTTECNISLGEIKQDALKYLYYIQCLLEGKSKNVELVAPFSNNTIEFFRRALLPYHIALLCLFLSKSTEEWEHFNFRGNVIGDVGVKVLAKFLLVNKKILNCITTLDLSSNYLSLQSATAISNIIQEGVLSALDLSLNNLGDSFIHEFSKALQVNSTLKKLILELNNIGVDGAKSLAVSLYHNRTLEYFAIGYNEIMDDGAMVISECFKISGRSDGRLTCIKSLSLSANYLTSHSKTAISTIIQEGALVSLYLSCNNLGESGAYEISKSLQANLSLKTLFLSSNSIGPGGALSIAVALCHNHTLEDLRIRDNGILDDGAIAIAECLKTNWTLKHLDVSNNNITEIGATDLVEILTCNPTLVTIKIDKSCIKILEPYNKQLVYNDTIGRHYHAKVNSYKFGKYEGASLTRTWL